MKTAKTRIGELVDGDRIMLHESEWLVSEIGPTLSEWMASVTLIQPDGLTFCTGGGKNWALRHLSLTSDPVYVIDASDAAPDTARFVQETGLDVEVER